MNSIPVQLLAVGGQLNVLGAGVRPPGADDTAAGGDAFLGLLQQMLLGGGMQMTVNALAPPADTGTTGSGDDGSGGETPPADPLGALAPGGSLGDLLSSELAGAALQSTGTSSGTPEATAVPLAVATAPVVEASAPVTAQEQATPAPVPALSAPAMDAILAMMEPVAEEQVTAPTVSTPQVTPEPVATPDPVAVFTTTVVEDPVTPVVVSTLTDNDKPVPVPIPKQGKSGGEVKLVRRAGTLASAPDLSSKVPVSPKEGDKMPVRAQATAPASMEEVTGSEDLRRMVRVLQHVSGTVDAQASGSTEAAVRTDRVTAQAATKEITSDAPSSSVPREQDANVIKTVQAPAQTAQDGMRDSMQHKEQAFAQPVSALTKPEGGRTAEFNVRMPESFVSLPPETAKSVVDQVVRGMALQVNGENSEVRIKLVPESLGEVTVHVKMDGGKMQAQIDVSQAGVKSALEVQLPQIRQSLSERGIDVQRLDVSFGGDHPAKESGGGQDGRRQRQGSKHAYMVDTVEQFDTGRTMGYNTMEMVM
jgi:flagellar hook-length control protein FliK